MSTPKVQPPQQARSRAALQRLLTSAEHVLVADGADELTIARVAEHAGVSVGGIYRRFANKEQLIDAVRQNLLTRLQETIIDGLDNAEPSLAGVIEAFMTAMGTVLAESGLVIPTVLVTAGRNTHAPEQGRTALTGLQQRFLGAIRPFRKEIRHPDPDLALNIAFRSMVSTGAHRAALAPWWPDDLSWQQWAREIACMTTAYLTEER